MERGLSRLSSWHSATPSFKKCAKSVRVPFLIESLLSGGNILHCANQSTHNFQSAAIHCYLLQCYYYLSNRHILVFAQSLPHSFYLRSVYRLRSRRLPNLTEGMENEQLVAEQQRHVQLRRLPAHRLRYWTRPSPQSEFCEDVGGWAVVCIYVSLFISKTNLHRVSEKNIHSYYWL